MRRSRAWIVAGMTGAGLAMPGLAASGSAVDPPSAGGLTAAEESRLAAGMQLAPLGSGATGADPNIAYLPDLHKVDFASWAQAASARSQAATSDDGHRAKARYGGAGAPLAYREKEPAGVVGRNDTTWTAEKVSAFGLGAGLRNRMVVSGSLADNAPTMRALPTAAEDNGSIPLASKTGIRGNDRIRVSGRIGDGPQGPFPGDFDWYRVDAKAGETVTAKIAASQRSTMVTIWDARGVPVALGWNSTDPGIVDEIAQFTTTSDGTFYVQVLDERSWQIDPFDSASGTTEGRGGTYTAEIGSWRTDRDAILVKLRRGDVLGTSVAGAAKRVMVQRWDSTYVTGQSGLDLSGYYPTGSPLPRGGNANASYVVEADGWYGVIVDTGLGAYRHTVEVYRPGGEGTRAPQTIYLDFDGAVVDTTTFGWEDGGKRKLSPLKKFLAGWGLKESDLPALAAQITKTASENLRTDMRAMNIPNLQIQVVNGLQSADLTGKPHVSRVVVGGTIDESGIETVGIANAIDPGNYGRTDEAIVLLDLMSAPVKGNQSAVVSLNYYLRPSTDKVRFVGTAIGNVVAHEAGHFIGNWHTNNTNDVTSLMDSGGLGFWRMFQAGKDRIGGTADDGDTDFATDRYSPWEGFVGVEDTRNVTAWAFSAKR